MSESDEERKARWRSLACPDLTVNSRVTSEEDADHCI